MNMNDIPLYPNSMGAMPTVGGYIGDLFDSVETAVNAMIQSATNAALELEIEAGEQLAIAIQNAENAYKDVLELTIDKVEQVVTDSLNQLDGMLEEFQARNQDFLNDVAQRVQVYINSLPRSSKAPQVIKSGPNCVVIDSDKPNFFTFSGNFPCSADPAYPPKLEFNGVEAPLVNSTTTELTFCAKASDIFPNGDINQYSYQVGRLKLPFDDSEKLSPADRRRGKKLTTTYEFKILETALPKSPGKITAIYSSIVAGNPIQKTFKSDPVTHYNGSDAYYKGRPCKAWDVHHMSFKPDEGFKFVKGSEVLVRSGGAHGNHYEKFFSTQESEIITEVGLDACSGKHMGDITYHIECQEIQPTKVEVIHQEPINLFWGNSSVLQLNNSNGRLISIICALFDGSTVTFGPATDLTNRYITVRNEGTSVKIEALPADKIKV